ncbi:MAG: alpha-L-rhamnosidase [Clostridia bacterium]|nr:alpha-L-rhamnosidase [Clostridia bacterium]
MKQSKWIWYPGDFEIYHHLLLSCRREELGTDMPCAWHLCRPEASMRFHKTFTAEKEGKLTIITQRSKGIVRFDGAVYPVNTPIAVSPGEHRVVVEVFDIEAFPTIYAESDVAASDGSWTAEPYDVNERPCCCSELFTGPDADPAVFPFSYKALTVRSIEETGGGRLYDFGKETFAVVTVESGKKATVSLTFGESREEALDPENAIIRDRALTVLPDAPLSRPARAFRYVFVKSDAPEETGLEAKEEYLPLADKASFTCDREIVSDIWRLCRDTFHLNSREFFLDGIKRDRWVWSGDAYQSFMIARYLYNDPSVTERTIRALLGKPPYRLHVNTINDYSAYLIVAVWEHYFAGGDLQFLYSVYPDVKALCRFIEGRLDENGYAVSRYGDWVFIDWGVLDKEGPHCCEQILLWAAYGAMAKLSAAVGEKDEWSEKREALQKNILRDYWDEEKGAFIDSFTSGKRFVSRQTNVMAVLFDFISGEKLKCVTENALLSVTLPAITTPYFKLYELLALCRIGKLPTAQNYIESYWGGMLKEGATSVWEEYDPEKEGAGHYAMYGKPYGKSLCHAWGSGPILLLCRWCAGVAPSSVGSKTFTVAPDPGIYRRFEATVPVGKGEVRVRYDAPAVSVTATVPGGVYLDGDGQIPLEPGKEYRFKLQT